MLFEEIAMANLQNNAENKKLPSDMELMGMMKGGGTGKELCLYVMKRIKVMDSSPTCTNLVCTW